MDGIDRAAALAKLELSAEERKAAEAELNRMLGYFEVLKEAGEETGAEIVKNAPKLHEGMFSVPKTF